MYTVHLTNMGESRIFNCYEDARAFCYKAAFEATITSAGQLIARYDPIARRLIEEDRPRHHRAAC